MVKLKHNLYRLEPCSPSLNPILQSFDDVSLSKEDIEKIVPNISSFVKLIKNAKIENKLWLLTGEYIGREIEVYASDTMLDKLIVFVEQLPKRIDDEKKKQILRQEMQKVEEK